MGSPLVPLVNSSTASASGSIFLRPLARESSEVGKRKAAARCRSFAHGEIFPISLSICITRGVHGNFVHFASIGAAVRIVLMPACSRQARAADSLEVGLRFTGTLPAKSRPTFASVPAVPGGRITPTRRSGRDFFHWRASAMLMPSSSPARRDFFSPVGSTSAVRNGSLLRDSSTRLEGCRECGAGMPLHRGLVKSRARGPSWRLRALRGAAKETVAVRRKPRGSLVK